MPKRQKAKKRKTLRRARSADEKHAASFALGKRIGARMVYLDFLPTMVYDKFHALPEGFAAKINSVYNLFIFDQIYQAVLRANSLEEFSKEFEEIMLCQ